MYYPRLCEYAGVFPLLASSRRMSRADLAIPAILKHGNCTDHTGGRCNLASLGPGSSTSSWNRRRALVGASVPRPVVVGLGADNQKTCLLLFAAALAGVTWVSAHVLSVGAGRDTPLVMLLARVKRLVDRRWPACNSAQRSSHAPSHTVDNPSGMSCHMHNDDAGIPIPQDRGNFGTLVIARARISMKDA